MQSVPENAALSISQPRLRKTEENFDSMNLCTSQNQADFQLQKAIARCDSDFSLRMGTVDPHIHG